MKYCKNCGMLLEDTQEICMGCGFDVSDPENTSEFPLEVAEKMESQKAMDKKKTTIVIAIVVVFILLAVLIGVIAAVASKGAGLLVPPGTEKEEEEEEEEETEEEPEQAAAEPGEAEEEAETVEVPEHVVPDNRKVSDDLGTYYIVGEVRDDAGVLMLTTLYPEDFGGAEPEATFDYTRYSDKFPGVVSCVITDADNTMRLTFMSTEHFWYQVSQTTGKKRNNEVDLDNYMSFLTYDGPQNYLEALIKQAYSGGKLELVESREATGKAAEALQTLISNKTAALTGDIGDYARIGSSTTYSISDSGGSAVYYKYKISTKGGDVFADYYVPMIYHTFSYDNDQLGDSGTITEWLPLCVVGYECGNEERYKFYEEAFTVFAANSRLTADFFRMNETYGDMIDSAVDAHTEPEPLTPGLLGQLESGFDPSSSLRQTDSDILNFLSAPDGSLKSFVSGERSVTGAADTVQAFYSESEKKVFITPSDTEYPGDEYVDLFAD